MTSESPQVWPDRDGRTPLHYAAADDEVEAARALLDQGADPDSPDRAGFTPLHFAAQQGSLHVAALLLDRGAQVDPQDKSGNSPLSNAVFNSRGDGAMIQLLRQRGADPAMPNNYGTSPLELARRIGNFPVAQWFADLPDSPPSDSS